MSIFKMKYIYIIAFSILTISFSCKSEPKDDKKPITGNGADAKPMMVEGIIAKSEIRSGSITTSGTIIANEEVEVKSEVAGKITGIFFKEGQAVSRGQLMVKLNDNDLQAQIKKLEIEIKLAEEKEKRQKQLLASSAISKEEYDIAETNLNLLKANVDIIKTDIDKTRMTAPFSGIAGLKNVSPGAFITSSTIITTIQGVQPLKLEFSIPEKYNSNIKVGSDVTFNVVGSSQTFRATVYAKEPKIDPIYRTVKIRATFQNPGGKLAPGSFADVSIAVEKNIPAIMIPSMAYIPDISGAKVFVAKNGKAESIRVKSGIRTETSVQILEGVQAGDTVLTTGILQLKPQSPVTVKVVNPTGQNQ